MVTSDPGKSLVQLRHGSVLDIRERRPGTEELLVEIDGREARAIAYPELTGAVAVGDTVVLNTTAVELGLGTGGFHFVVAVEGARESGGVTHGGRVMKARYTPLQAAVRSVEETEAALLEKSPGLEGLPVVVAPLHSMIGPVAAGARAEGAKRIAYVMTDGAALPGSFSRLVPRLRETGLLDSFITCGQCFGGELETVTVWTGLLAAKDVVGADVAIVADGPGNLGTETRWGVSALSTGNSLNAVAALGGRPVAALRISFADQRKRHHGVSHHSLTILSDVCLVPATVAVPALVGDEREQVWASLQEAGLVGRHELVEADGGPALKLLDELAVEIQSMGRRPKDDPVFFLSAGAAGIVAGRLARQPLE
jgi:hypothetical protein